MTPLLLVLLAQPVSLNLNQAPIIVKDEGVAQSNVRAITVNCTGAGVSCTQSGSTMTLNVAGGGGGGGGVSSVTASSPLASSGGATPDISLTGTVSQARGGTGAGALTCTSGQALTSNGSAYSCTSTITGSDLVCAGTCVSDAEIAAMAASKLTGTVAAGNGGLGATQPTCSAGDFLTCNGTTCSCGTPSGGGGGGVSPLFVNTLGGL